MKNLQSQKKELKIYSIIKFSSIGLMLLSLFLLFGQKIIALQIIGAFILLLSIPTIIITNKISKKLKETIKQIEIVKIGNEEAKK